MALSVPGDTPFFALGNGWLVAAGGGRGMDTVGPCDDLHRRKPGFLDRKWDLKAAACPPPPLVASPSPVSPEYLVFPSNPLHFLAERLSTVAGVHPSHLLGSPNHPAALCPCPAQPQAWQHTLPVAHCPCMPVCCGSWQLFCLRSICSLPGDPLNSSTQMSPSQGSPP